MLAACSVVRNGSAARFSVLKGRASEEQLEGVIPKAYGADSPPGQPAAPEPNFVFPLACAN